MATAFFILLTLTLVSWGVIWIAAASGNDVVSFLAFGFGGFFAVGTVMVVILWLLQTVIINVATSIS